MVLTELLIYTTLAGLAIPAGALLARIERLQPRWLETEFRHGVIAFGGGLLIAAVALVLVPEGVRHLSLGAVALAFGGGGLLFLGVDYWLAQRGDSAAQLVAMLLDFAPEALALGAAFGGGSAVAPLLALLIMLQNLPESFNSYRELRAGGQPGRRVMRVMLLLVPLGPACGLTGYYLLADHPAITGIIMLAAAGGILYLTFQDIAPQARLQRHWGPPLGAVAGFLAGLCGQQLLG